MLPRITLSMKWSSTCVGLPDLGRRTQGITNDLTPSGLHGTRDGDGSNSSLCVSSLGGCAKRLDVAVLRFCAGTVGRPNYCKQTPGSLTTATSPLSVAATQALSEKQLQLHTEQSKHACLPHMARPVRKRPRNVTSFHKT